MNCFSQLKVKPNNDGRYWILLEDLICQWNEFYIKIPKGFITDFASVPRIFWSFLPPVGRYIKPAVLHDYLYRYTKFNRKICDNIFLETMRDMKVPLYQRLLLYLGVRIGGWISYRKYEKQNTKKGR